MRACPVERGGPVLDLQKIEKMRACPVEQGNFVPNHDTEYNVAMCSGRKTLELIDGLRLGHGVHAFAPVIRRPGKKPLVALPGFLFIPTQEFEDAEHLARCGLVPPFSPLIMASKLMTCRHEELVVFEKAVNDMNIDLSLFNGSLREGDNVMVTAGPFNGLSAVVKGMRIEGSIMVTLNLDMFGKSQEISLPLSMLERT